MLTENDMKHLNPNKEIPISVYLRITVHYTTAQNPLFYCDY